MVSAEAAPFAKVGGLADVAGALPPALAKLDCDIRLMLPLYGAIDRKKFKIKESLPGMKIVSGKKMVKTGVWESILPSSSVRTYFLDAPKYFSGKEIYGRNGSEKFLFFSLAALKALRWIGFRPDIIHCNDFHTALIPDLLKTFDNPFYRGIKTLYTIHNLNYQGKIEPEILSTGNLNKNSLKSLAKDALDGDVNFMVQGIIGADLVNTVSRNYAKEITSSIYGAGLEKVIRANKRKIIGIENGIDYELFDPQTDTLIKKKYGIKSLENKNENKLYLQKIFGLPRNPRTALIGMVSRLSWQKGFELITENLAELDCQFAILGTGEKKYERQLSALSRKYPEKFSTKLKFDLKLARRIYAGSDLFLAPSRFEPCGLTQMVAMRYGTIPIVRATGGLADTVDAKTGFRFKEFSPEALYSGLEKALAIFYQHPKKWKQMMTNGMKKDFSWKKPAKEYLKLYRKLIKQ